MTQQQCRSVVLWQPGEGLLDILAPAYRALDRLITCMVVTGQERNPLHDLAPAQLADSGIGGDSVEPGLEGEVRPRGGERVVSLDEGVLGEVFRHRSVADHAMQVVEDWSMVMLEEPGKGDLIALAGTPHEIRIV